MHCYFTQAGIKTEVQNKQCKRKDYVPAVTASVHQKDIKELDTINYLSDSVCPQECSGSLVFMKNTASMNLPAEEQESLDSHKRHADMEQPVTTAKYGSDVMLENSFPPETSSLNQDSIHERGNVVRITYSCPTSCRDVEKTRNAPCTVLDSPFKWCSSEESDREQDDLYHSVATSQLFTQDSQGNRVISHYRKKKYLSVPLQDMTNKCQDILNTPSDSLSCNDDSLQRMFTQDSEGNVVIKH
ncbi:hypothetical protein XENTR_v10005741 [Xenopus tropicalis]|nr:hypothetical protein XENTR_v10005741 [Xenopus tropicalis]